MLNHRFISILFLISLSVCGVGYMFFSWSAQPIMVAFLVYTLIEAWGSFAISKNYFTRATCSFDTDKREIVLTFDDGPVRDVTPAVLHVLRKYGVSATFFCVGHKVEEEGDLLRHIHDEGHIVALHSHSHSYMYDFNTPAGFRTDLNRNQSAIEAIIDFRPRFFRPPYGVTTPFMHRIIKEKHLDVIGWNVRSFDTVIKDEEKVLRRIKDRIKPGAIILLHDHLTTTPRLLDRLLDYLVQEKYTVVSLADAINLQPYETSK